MVMKKASGDDSPLRQGAGKSFWTLLISGRRRRRLAACFVEKCSYLQGFPDEENLQAEGRCQGMDQGPTPPGGVARGGSRHPMVRPPPSLAPSLLWTPSSFQVNRNFGFCFVQLREYFLCNFFETQKQQKTGTGTVASH
jgi:hypothetical protein